jgi:GMP synthase (glutamine-hydrolysing)
VEHRQAPHARVEDADRPLVHARDSRERAGRLDGVRVLALTHGSNVGPGVFAEAIRAEGHQLVERVVPSEGLPSHGADAVIVLGGAMHPDQEETHGWLRAEVEWIRGELRRGTPLLGVCLGSQLLARAAGAEVYRASEPEVGWLPVEVSDADDPVAAALPARFDAFQFHEYTHELPAGAVELARSRVCTQAYRLGNAWGVQFHPEVRLEQIESWAAEEPPAVGDLDAFLEESRRRIGDWNELGRRLCAAFLGAA